MSARLKRSSFGSSFRWSGGSLCSELTLCEGLTTESGADGGDRGGGSLRTALALSSGLILEPCRDEDERGRGGVIGGSVLLLRDGGRWFRSQERSLLLEPCAADGVLLGGCGRIGGACG